MGATQIAKVSRSSVSRRRQLLAPKPANPGPVVKWAGGKTRLLPEILRRAPETFHRYLEPFLGGGAVFFRLSPKQALLGDMNEALVNMYQSVGRDVEGVIRNLYKHRQKHSIDYYYEMRERWNGGYWRSPTTRAAAFIYINKTCYNGLWRVNSSGRFNVPVGRYTAPQIFDPQHLRITAQFLQKAEVEFVDYLKLTERAESGDFVYFDPPYQPVSKTAQFTSYTCDNFGENDQKKLAECVQNLARRGVSVMVSNSDTTLIRDLYQDWKIHQVRAPRAINSKGTHGAWFMKCL